MHCRRSSLFGAVLAILPGVLVDRVCVADPGTIAGSPSGQQFELLWPGGAPDAKGNGTSDTPAISVHLPADDAANGAAVIVNPGGGYHVLASDHEGLQMARELNRHGIAAFVLRYRLRPTYEPKHALNDAKRAIRHVRQNATRYRIDPKRLGMLGFSAGGHLASWVGTDFDSGNPDSSDETERQSCRPDFLCLIYPAISGKLFGSDRSGDWISTDESVTEKTPPTFLAHTHEDNLSPFHSVRFYSQLLKCSVPAELHVFGHGPHGLGLAPGDPDMRAWPQLFVNWMRRRGLLSNAVPQAAGGKVVVEGEPLFWGWITFIPKDKNLPTRACYVHQSDSGAFQLSESNGLAPGKYSVEVRVVATHFDQTKEGAYSIEDSRLYTTGADGQPLTIDVSADGAKDLEIVASR